MWIGPSWPTWLLVGPLAVAGRELALQAPAIQAAALEAAPTQEAGMASGVFSTSRYLGSILRAARALEEWFPTPAPGDAG